jgi:hypothetical protein
MTTALERVHARVGDLGADGVPLPLLTLAEFFDGNDEPGSILCNVVLSGAGEDEDDAPTPQQVRAVLATVAGRPEVADVRVVVTEADDPDWWPFADRVLVVTSADPEVVRGWFPADYAPDEVFPHADEVRPQPVEPYDVPAGHAAVICWWD